jgi:nitroreductase
MKGMKGMIQNETLALIKSRRSVRSFKEEQITEEELQAVLEAGQYAPSAMNQQQWHFTVVQNKEIMEMLNRDARQGVSQFKNEHLQQLVRNEKFHIFYHAPTVIIVSGNENAMAVAEDCAAANENMLLAAEAIGLGACWVNMVRFAFIGEKDRFYREKLGIPEGFKPFYSVILGYKNTGVLQAPARKENLVNYIR